MIEIKCIFVYKVNVLQVEIALQFILLTTFFVVSKKHYVRIAYKKPTCTVKRQNLCSTIKSCLISESV